MFCAILTIDDGQAAFGTRKLMVLQLFSLFYTREMSVDGSLGHLDPFVFQARLDAAGICANHHS